MADIRYSQVELNRCAFLHDGAIESQCVYEAKDENEVLQNGEIVIIDKAAGKIFSVANSDAAGDDAIYGLNYTSERIYNQFTPGRKNFYVANGEYPRVGILSKGDLFTTDANLTVAIAEGIVAKVKDTTNADGSEAVQYVAL